MKAKLLPIRFKEANERENKEFEQQLNIIKSTYGYEAEFLEPFFLGDGDIPTSDAVVFPQLIGATFKNKSQLKKISVPIIVLTSSFSTVEMWDWEIIAYMREELGLNVFSPYNIPLGKVIIRAISSKNLMKKGIKFLMYQDSPGEGMQANIFKRFYWWETECTEQIERAFGIKIVYRSWKELNDRANLISDESALELWTERSVPNEGIPMQNILKAVKIYMAVKDDINFIGDIYGVGSNCLNESFNSQSTPCLAWNWLFEYDNILWACEGDTVTLISKFILYSALKHPIMMTNIYPFLVGMAALKHEKIEEFPNIEDPSNHALGVHCGYFGFVPQSFCSEWRMRPKVLEIVDSNAIVIDCRMQEGPVVMAKLHPNMKKITIIEAEIEKYVQYPGSDCMNGALIRYRNNSGHKVMNSLSSHHAIIIKGDITHELIALANVYGFEYEVL